MTDLREWIGTGTILLATGLISCQAAVGGGGGDGDGDSGPNGSETPADPTGGPVAGGGDVPIPTGDGDTTAPPPVGDGDAATGDGDLPAGDGDTDPIGGDGDLPSGDGDSTVPPSPYGPAACSSEAAGRAEGDFAEDFTLLDQNGNQVSPSDYCGQVVYIPLGAMWCPACQSTSEEIPSTMAEYGAQGFIVLNLMAETNRGATPSQEDLTAWATTYDLTTPVLSDADWAVWERYWPEHSTPKELLIDREGRLVVIGWVGGRQIESVL